MPDRPRVLIVEARFYPDIADELAKGAIAELDKAGVTYSMVEVPGVFEIPAAIRFAVRSMEVGSATRYYGGFLPIGCVIRGETDHYDHICREMSRAIMDLSINYSLAIGFGVLTCETREQAWERADVTQRNKGGEAARACLRMMELKAETKLNKAR